MPAIGFNSDYEHDRKAEDDSLYGTGHCCKGSRSEYLTAVWSQAVLQCWVVPGKRREREKEVHRRWLRKRKTSLTNRMSTV